MGDLGYKGFFTKLGILYTMARRKSGNDIHGWVIVDKPVGVTSTQVVGQVRRAFNAKRAGHGGTLDPFATGVLPIALGDATKTMQYALNGDKSYQFTLSFGTATDTGDPTGQTVATSDCVPTMEQIRAIIPQFVGNITQIPPKYSALKIQGQRAYDLARAGVEFDIQPRPVTIHKLSLSHCINEKNYVFDCTVSKGTYIRTLGADMAVALGTVGHLADLRRTAVAHFGVDSAISLDIIGKMGDKHGDGSDNPQQADILRPIDAVLDGIPVLAVSADLAQRLMHGQRLTHATIMADNAMACNPSFMDNTMGDNAVGHDFSCTSPVLDSPHLVRHADGRPIALAQWVKNQTGNIILQPVRLFSLTDAETQE